MAAKMSLGVGSAPLSPALLITLFGFLAAAVVWDLHQRRIPNLLPLVLAAMGLVVNLFLQPLGTALLTAVTGLLAGFVIWLLPYLLRMAGGADVKLAAAVGVWLGPLGVLRASLYAGLAGGLMALLMLLRYHGFLGSWVLLKTARHSRGGIASAASPKVSTLPYAVALAIGVAFELLSFDLLGGLS
jgi:prepilin peptidase CpaA